MDIQQLSMDMAQVKVADQASTAVLKKTLDNFKQSGEQLTKMMEMSVNPNVGGHVDIKV